MRTIVLEGVPGCASRVEGCALKLERVQRVLGWALHPLHLPCSEIVLRRPLSLDVAVLRNVRAHVAHARAGGLAWAK